MNKAKNSDQDSILYKMANHRFEDRNACFSFNNCIAYFIIYPLVSISFLYIVIYDIMAFILNINIGFNFPPTLIFGPGWLCLLFSKIQEYTKLSDVEIESTYEIIKTNDNVLYEFEHLYKKQGFILEKQKKELLRKLDVDAKSSN